MFTFKYITQSIWMSWLTNIFSIGDSRLCVEIMQKSSDIFLHVIREGELCDDC